MEKENKNGGLDGVDNTKGRREGSAIGKSEIGLRVLAVLLTLIAAILLGVNKQTKMVPMKLTDALPAFNVPVTAKTSYVSAFVYSVVANSIACALGAITVALTFTSKGGLSRLMILIVDLMMVALLFSGIGATGAVGLIGLKGNTHLRWNKVCNIYGKFCHQVMASLGLSFLGAIVFVTLLSITLSKLVKRAS